MQNKEETNTSLYSRKELEKIKKEARKVIEDVSESYRSYKWDRWGYLVSFIMETFDERWQGKKRWIRDRNKAEVIPIILPVSFFEKHYEVGIRQARAKLNNYGFKVEKRGSLLYIFDRRRVRPERVPFYKEEDKD